MCGTSLVVAGRADRRKQTWKYKKSNNDKSKQWSTSRQGNLKNPNLRRGEIPLANGIGAGLVAGIVALFGIKWVWAF